MESSLCWKHLSGCFILRLLFGLTISLCFFILFSHVWRHSHIHIIPSPDPVCSWYGVTLLCWAKIQPLLQHLSHKTCVCCHISCVRCVLSSPFSAFFSLLSPACRPISHTIVSGVFAVPEQSRLANEVKDRGVEQGAWGSSPANPTSLANILHWSWAWL